MPLRERSTGKTRVSNPHLRFSIFSSSNYHQAVVYSRGVTAEAVDGFPQRPFLRKIEERPLDRFQLSGREWDLEYSRTEQLQECARHKHSHKE